MLLAVLGAKGQSARGWRKHIDNLWLTAEVFNLLNIKQHHRSSLDHRCERQAILDPGLPHAAQVQPEIDSVVLTG